MTAMRNLVISSPHATGPDVKALQAATNARSKGFKSPIQVDGDFGMDSLHGAREEGYWQGLPDLQLSGPVRPYLQVRLIDPSKRTAKEIERGRERIERRHKEVGPGSALAWAHAQIGTTEHPYGSNRGPKVSAWQRVFGMDGQPWCGAFVGNALRHAGVPVTNRIVYCPYIVADGEHHANGFAARVSYAQRAPGDLIVFNFGSGFQHVGILDHDRIHTIEGNTSGGSGGSQDNGGGVFRRERPRGTMAAIIRPRW